MSYEVTFSDTARSDLQKLTPSVQERILKKIRWLSGNFELLTPQTLSADFSGSFKLRVGDYRVIYSFDTEMKVITILRIGHRREVYT